MRVAPSYTLTKLPGSAVPVRVRVVSEVRPSPSTPVSVPMAVIAGAAGAVVSTVQITDGVNGEVLSAASVAFTLRS